MNYRADHIVGIFFSKGFPVILKYFADGDFRFHNYILKENKITYKEFDKDVIYEFTYEEGNYPKELDNYIK